jgi:tetratricopeptide (TPR) repeat protein
MQNVPARRSRPGAAASQGATVIGQDSPSVAAPPPEPVARTGAETAADNPEAYIARDRRRALAAGLDLPDRVVGSALFADISGFTPLTEALATELGPQRGSEELTVNLGRVFSAVIAELDAFGGDVIYFSGDAITCWIDGDDGLAAVSAAQAMIRAIERTGLIVTPNGTEVRLSMKVAVAVGRARRFVVGDPDVQLIDVLAGTLVDDLAEAEHHAEKGEVVLEPSAIASLGERVVLGEHRLDSETDREYAVLAEVPAPAARIEVIEPPVLPEELVRPWLLPAVYERIRTGRGEFLTEIRLAIPVFLRFGGIDYDEDDDAARKLDEFVRGAQRIMAGYGGNVLQLTLGDKGAYLYGVFGSPIAHEDDPARAAAAALELRDLEKTTSARDVQIGITRGRLRSGTYGHPMRRTFVCLGDEVNLSARLMSAAPAHRIYVSERIQQAAGEAFIWERLPDMKVKGKSKPVAVYALGGSLERASRRKTRFELRLVGRRRELATLQTRLAEARGGHGRILGIAAEAGMGKSRLVAEFVRSARRSGHLVAFGECQAFGTNTAYFVFREIWRRLLKLEDGDPQATQVAFLEREVAGIDPALVARVPLLSPIVELPIPDSELTRSFDAKLRKASLEDLLTTVLAAKAGEEPLVVVLEDCHWIDELSRDLLRMLVRAASSLRVLFVLAYRPAATPGGDLGLESLPYFEEMALDRLDEEDATAVVRSKLEQVMGQGAVAPDDLARTVAERADGNPLYIEELVSFITSRGLDLTDPSAIERLQLPESLQTIILSRIDTVPEAPRRTMKVASVVGRVFRAPVLPGAYEELGTLDAVRGDLEVLRQADLVGLEREEDLSYLFKHAVTQEVAYESMPFRMRSMLHRRVGDYLAASDPEGVDRNLDLLAHHYWLGDDEAKKRAFLDRAAAAAQKSYANTAAIDYYTRLTPLLPDEQRGARLLELGKVLELVGDWARAETVVREALALAIQLDDSDAEGWAEAALAEISRKQGQFDDAAAHLASATTLFQAEGDDAGLGQVEHLAGTVCAQRGDLPGARRHYQASLGIRERLGDLAKMGALYSNLAIVAEYSGDLPLTRQMGERALELRTSANDRWGIGVSLGNLAAIAVKEGALDEARARSEAAIRVLGEVGDRWMTANAENNLGNAARDLGDYPAARAAYAAALRTFAERDDRWALAILLEDIGLLASAMGNHARAVELVEAASALREEIGASQAETLAAELREKLGPSVSALGAAGAAQARARGRARGLVDAVALGMEVCTAD